MGSHLRGYLMELTIRGLCGCSGKNPRNKGGKTRSSLAEADGPNLYTCLHIYNTCHSKGQTWPQPNWDPLLDTDTYLWGLRDHLQNYTGDFEINIHLSYFIRSLHLSK